MVIDLEMQRTSIPLALLYYEYSAYTAVSYNRHMGMPQRPVSSYSTAHRSSVTRSIGRMRRSAEQMRSADHHVCSRARAHVRSLPCSLARTLARAPPILESTEFILSP